MTPTLAPIDRSALSALADEALDWRFKAIPPAAWGMTAGEFLATGPRLTDFGTPLLTLDAQALAGNVATMSAFCADAGVELSPHGKTTMAPALWARQLEAGARGITLANLPQLRVARAFGVRRLLLANELVDPAGLRWISGELDADPAFEFTCWVDARRTVELMDEVLRAHGAQRPLDVFVELGGPGGRAGVRDLDEAVDIARAVAATSTLRLTGVAGYEGAMAHDASPDALAAVDGFLRRLGELHDRVLIAGLYDQASDVFISAGGSAYFDQVIDILGGRRGPGVNILLRSGAYVVHDDGHYRGVSAFARKLGSPLTSAMHGWARVLSRPEPELALLDGGKRDFPFDDGLPAPQHVRGKPGESLSTAWISALSDQHTFLRLDQRAPVSVGDVVRLGLSHPCTAFDKWSLVPVLDDASSPEPIVVDLVRTFF